MFLSHKDASAWLAASHSALLNHTTYPDHVSLSSSPSFHMKGVHLLTPTNVFIHDLSVVKQTPSHSFKDMCQFLVLFYLNVTKHGVSHKKYSFLHVVFLIFLVTLYIRIQFSLLTMTFASTVS